MIRKIRNHKGWIKDGKNRFTRETKSILGERFYRLYDDWSEFPQI